MRVVIAALIVWLVCGCAEARASSAPAGSTRPTLRVSESVLRDLVASEGVQLRRLDLVDAVYVRAQHQLLVSVSANQRMPRRLVVTATLLVVLRLSLIEIPLAPQGGA